MLGLFYKQMDLFAANDAHFFLVNAKAVRPEQIRL